MLESKIEFPRRKITRVVKKNDLPTTNVIKKKDNIVIDSLNSITTTLTDFRTDIETVNGILNEMIIEQKNQRLLNILSGMVSYLHNKEVIAIYLESLNDYILNDEINDIVVALENSNYVNALEKIEKYICKNKQC